MRAGIAVLSLVLWAGSASATDADDIREFLAVPIETRVSSAIKAGDHRYLGVNGYALEVPGFADASFPAGAVLVIPGTSDDGDPALNESAREYAAQYNRLLKERLAKLGG